LKNFNFLISDSKLLDNSMMLNLFSFGLTKKIWKRIYCASIDGFSSTNFHSKCNNKGPTLVVIRSNNGNIFGGYTSLDWDSSNNNKPGGTNWLFILKGQTPQKLNNNGPYHTNNAYSIYCYSNYGPTFGKIFLIFLILNLFF